MHGCSTSRRSNVHSVWDQPPQHCTVHNSFLNTTVRRGTVQTATNAAHQVTPTHNYKQQQTRRGRRHRLTITNSVRRNLQVKIKHICASSDTDSHINTRLITFTHFIISIIIVGVDVSGYNDQCWPRMLLLTPGTHFLKMCEIQHL